MSQRKKSTRCKRNPKNLYQRNGIWWIRYRAGSQVVRSSLRTSSVREAKRLRDEILAKRTAAARFGIEPEQAKPSKTFAQIAAMWIDARQADTSLAESTREQYARVTRQVLIPAFGTMATSAITVEDIERFIAQLRSKYSRPTVSLYFRILSSIIRQAIRRGWYSGMNPLDRLDRKPSQGPGRETVLTLDEAPRLLAELSGSLYYKCALSLLTGLRWGEVHGLAWDDLELETNPSLTIRRSFRRSPKTKASATTIPLSSQAVALMRRWQAEQLISSPYVFPTHHGRLKARACQKDRKKIQEAAKRAGIAKHVTPHVFRHTYGTIVFEQIGDPKILQRLMRHASFKTSMGYVHDRRALAPIVEKLPSLEPRADKDREETQNGHSESSDKHESTEILDDSDPTGNNTPLQLVDLRLAGWVALGEKVVGLVVEDLVDA